MGIAVRARRNRCRKRSLARKLGVGFADAGARGVCPYCHSNNFFLQEDGTAICCLCGMEGVMKNVDGKYVFEYDAEKWLPHAHDSISGKFIHGDDIQNNEGKARAAMATDEAKARKAKYRDFISSSRPVRA